MGKPLDYHQQHRHPLHPQLQLAPLARQAALGLVAPLSSLDY